MRLTLMEVTSQVEEYISSTLVLASLRYTSSDLQTAGVSLPDLYLNVRSHFASIPNGFDLPTGIFNKVIDDMSRVGLLRVDRKTKRLAYIVFDRLVSEHEMALLKAQVEREKMGGAAGAK